MEYSVNDAARHAKTYCDKHKGWQRICDVKESEILSLRFDELPLREQRAWKNQCPTAPEDSWKEFGIAPSRHPFKFMSGAGEIYGKHIDVPSGHQVMMLFNTSRTRKGGYRY